MLLVSLVKFARTYMYTEKGGILHCWVSPVLACVHVAYWLRIFDTSPRRVFSRVCVIFFPFPMLALGVRHVIYGLKGGGNCAAGSIVLAYAKSRTFIQLLFKRGRALGSNIYLRKYGLIGHENSPFSVSMSVCALLCFLNPKSEFAHLFQTPMQWVSRKKTIKKNKNR